jgi:hypothetical protein
LLGNVAAIVVTIAAFLQAVSWVVAGVLILIALVFPLLASISPPRGSMTPHSASKITSPSHHSQSESKTTQHRSNEKHGTSTHQAPTKVDQRSPPRPEPDKILGPKPIPRTAASQVGAAKSGMAKIVPTPRPLPVREGPNFSPTIAKGDYAEYDVELETGKGFSGEVTATGLVNIYLLDEDNLDNLDQGEEFWSETGEEGVERATLEFTAPSKGKWFFVVENADDRAVSATVKIQKGTSSSTTSS